MLNNQDDRVNHRKNQIDLLEKNPKEIRRMFDKISHQYDLMNDILSCFSHIKVKTQAIEALNLKDNIKVLDLCCGTGDLGHIIKKKYPKTQVIGVDFSRNMLKIASRKNKNIEYYEADATNLSFADDYFDCVVMGFGLRNIQEPENALCEIYRVLKREGKFLHLDFDKQGKYIRLYDKIMPYILRLFAKDLTPYKYLLNSKNEFYSNDELIEFFEDNKFGFVSYNKTKFDMISYQVMKKY